jgi:hypothetical protein
MVQPTKLTLAYFDNAIIHEHVLYTHEKHFIGYNEIILNNCDVIKGCHFYIRDDCEHDTLLVPHCFDLIYKSLNLQGVVFNEHWVWLTSCATKLKPS